MSRVRYALYVRVSTINKTRLVDKRAFEQNPDVQEKPLRDLVAQREGEVYKVYGDRLSGTAEHRPGLKALMADAKRGLFDVVVVWRFDRFARSVKQLVLALEEFGTLGIEFISHQEALDTSTPMGKAMFTLIGAMAELERGVIRERVIAGLQHAQNFGTRSGRPIGRPRAVFRRDEVLALRAKGLSWTRIAQRLGTSSASARRACQRLADGDQPCQNPR